MKHRLDSAYWYMDTHFVDLLLDGVLQMPSTGVDLAFAVLLSCILV